MFSLEQFQGRHRRTTETFQFKSAGAVKVQMSPKLQIMYGNDGSSKVFLNNG